VAPATRLRSARPPGTLRARLIVNFALIVGLALIIVLAALPRLLDGYFIKQSEDELRTRTGVMKVLVYTRLVQFQTVGVDAPHPILQVTQPVSASQFVTAALGTEGNGFLHDLTQNVAQANVSVTIASAPERPQDIGYRLAIELPDGFGRPGQQREPFSYADSIKLADLFYAQSPTAPPERLVTVTLSEPFSFRAQTLETIVGVMSIAAAVALLIAFIASILLANRLTDPLRRLTGAARALSEGKLDVRVTAPPGTHEMAELTSAFNTMAERLETSIDLIQRDRDRSREFVAEVSHELRTPIAALRTFNELLADGAMADDATRREFLEQSRQQIERLDWLSTNLLELSKLDSGLVLLDLRPEDLRTVIESAVEQAQPAAERKHVALVVDQPPEPVRQRHDPQRLGQVVSNLIANALKFTPEGGHVTIRLRPTDEGADLSVSDDGVGIPAAELPYVFDRFYRGSWANESRATGSGLGLSIVRSIVDMHNGRVAITSAPGKGTEVTISLPRDMSVSSPPDGRAATAA
jgi:two-component system, OmpR family, sensor histidine kinase BaeS